MTGLVLDASAFVFAFTETSAAARSLRTRIAEARCHAPHLVDAEVGSVARSKLLRRELDSAQAFSLLNGVARIIQRRYRHGPLARLGWSLRDDVSFYDAMYVALAASLGMPLLTADARLSRVEGLPCEVELVGQ
ncbi:MAG: type II toxin-antitoxin system VapC family toxin [Pseudonocardia sp.]